MRLGITARAGTTIEGVDLFRYAGARPTGSFVSSCGLIARVRARHSRNTVAGFGEAVTSHSQAAEAWRAMEAAAAPLVGQALPRRVDPANPLGEIDGWRRVEPTERAAARAARLAVEIALLDLLAKTGKPSLPGLDGVGEQPTAGPAAPVRQIPTVAPGPVPGRLSRELAQDPGDAWAVRLQSTGDPELDLAWLRRVTEIERRAGRDRPLWLAGGDLTIRTATEFVRQLAALVSDGELPSQVLLQEPLPRQQSSGLSRAQRRALLSELQHVADDALGRKRLEPATEPRLSIVAGDCVGATTDLDALCKMWPIGGVHLTASRWGSLVGLQQGARAAKRADPATTVLLGGEPGSRLTALALAALAAASPEVDRYLPAQPAAGWPRLAIDPGGARRTGLCAGVDLRELSGVVDRTAELPRPAESASTGTPPRNHFPEYQLPVGPWDARATSMLEVEMLRNGLRTKRFSVRLLLAERPGQAGVIGFDRARSTLTSVPGFAVAAYKGVTRQVLAEQGLPIAQGGHFTADQAEEAHAAGLALGFPLVVKPAGGTKGIGVTTNITSEEELARAIQEVAGSKYADSGIVLERFASGDDYRVLATPDEVLSVVRRVPASVTGDGRHTIEELVVTANAIRRLNPNLGKLSIPLDSRTDGQLRRQGLTRESVPGAGQHVQLAGVANLSQGGESYEVRDETHPSVLALAVAAVKAIPGLPCAGLDILMEDHRRPVDAQQVTIIEVNSIPMLTMHHFPMYGPPRNVSRRVLKDVVRATGLTLQPGPDDLGVRLAVFGRVQGVGYRRWLSRGAEQLGIECSVTNAAEPDRVDAVLRGPAPQVGMLLRLAFNGPPNARVVETRVEPIDQTATVADHVSDSHPVGTPAIVRSGTEAVACQGGVRGRRLQPGSRLMDAVARRRGLAVHRPGHDLVVCTDGPRRVGLRGLAGPSASTVAELLCENDAWVRRHLASHGLPTVPMRLVDLADADRVYPAVEAVGLPVAVWLLLDGTARRRVATDRGSFRELWGRLRRRTPDRRAQVVVERHPGDTPVAEVAVVAGRVVAVDYSDSSDSRPTDELVATACALAVRAVAALPGARYGSVRLLSRPGGPEGGLVIDSIDPLLGRWAVPDDSAGLAIAEAILDAELAMADAG